MPAGPTLLEHFGQLRADYDAAKTSELRRRRTGLPSLGATADYHYRSEGDYLKLQEIAWDVFRNDLVVGSGVRRLVKNVIQSGFVLDPDTGDSEADDLAEELWLEWAETKELCHAAGTLTWHQMEKLALQSQIVGGDCFGLPLGDDTLETVESYRCRTPSATKQNCIHGVLLDERGRPQEYWFTKQDIAPNQAVKLVRDVRPIKALNDDGEIQVFHLFDPQRFTQHRGVTVLAPSIIPAEMHDDMQFAEMVKQKIQACVGFIRELAGDKGPPEPGTAGETEERTSSAGVRRFLQHFYPGMEIVGKPGEQLKFFSPQIPGQAFLDHSKLILTFIAVNLDLPLQVLLLDPMRSNFSSWRGAIEQARISWRDMQLDLIAAWHRPVYRWRVRQWLESPNYDADPRCLKLRAIAADPGRKCQPFKHNWNPASWPYIEPLKDASADSLQQEKLLNSPRRIQARKGQNWQQVARESVEDCSYAIRLAKQAAAQINQDFPEDKPVHWRECLNLTSTEKLSLTVTAGGEDPPQGGDDADGQ